MLDVRGGILLLMLLGVPASVAMTFALFFTLDALGVLK